MIYVKYLLCLIACLIFVVAFNRVYPLINSETNEKEDKANDPNNRIWYFMMYVSVGIVFVACELG